MTNKPFGVFKRDNTWEAGLWEIHRRYATLPRALKALRDLTVTPRSKRKYVYTILSAEGLTTPYIQVKEDHMEKVNKYAR